MAKEKAKEVLLGFEVGSGRPINIPIGHMVVTGMTQQAGKTSTLEALVSRSGIKAIAFITKRGEGSFSNSHIIPPYFREHADWVFVSNLIDATLSEKNKFLRSWLMKVCRGTKTLAQVQKNVIAAKKTARGFSESIYTEIEGYLDLVVPEIAELPPSNGINLSSGLNVMDLSYYSTALQALVIRSAVEHIYENEKNVVAIIPEAWEFLPEKRGGPAKNAAEALIRKGGGLNNFMWVDSQDLAGVMKLALRAAPVYLIGVQREANEIKRTLSNIPDSVAKPKAKDVAMLELGQFYACWGRNAIKTYVQPVWMNPDNARQVALGKLSVDDVALVEITAGPLDIEEEYAEEPLVIDIEKPQWSKLLDEMEQGTADISYVNEDDMTIDREYMDKTTELLERIANLLENHAVFHDGAFATEKPSKTAEFSNGNGQGSTQHVDLDEDALFERLALRLSKNKALLKLAMTIPEIEIETIRPVVEMGDNLSGWVVMLISEGFFDRGANGQSAFDELMRRGKRLAKPNVYPVLRKLANLGALTIDKQGKSEIFTRNPELKITRKEKK